MVLAASEPLVKSQSASDRPESRCECLAIVRVALPLRRGDDHRHGPPQDAPYFWRRRPPRAEGPTAWAVLVGGDVFRPTA